MAVSQEKIQKKGLGKRIKETFIELKKVSWPTFAKVAKSTGAVLAIVLLFTAVLFGIDRLLFWLHGILIK